MPQLPAKTIQAKPQEGEPVYCSLIAKEQGRIDWKLRAVEIDAQVRAYTPWPLCFSQWEGEELYILEGRSLGEGFLNGAGSSSEKEKPMPGLITGIDRVNGILIQTGEGIYAVSRLQRRAKKALDWKAFLNGARDLIGARLG
jgi:methionyl-tRNA formyltransferase